MSTLNNSEKTTVPVSPTKCDNGEKEEQHQLELGELRKEENRNKELKEENKEIMQAFSELQKDFSGLQMKHAVLKLEQQVKLQFRFELVTACIHIFSLVVCMLAFCQGWFKMHVDDTGSRNWWSWWYSEVLEGLSGETFYVCVLCLNLLLALFKFIFVYLIST